MMHPFGLCLISTVMIGLVAGASCRMQHAVRQVPRVTRDALEGSSAGQA